MIMEIFSSGRSDGEFEYRKNLSLYDDVEINESDRYYKTDKSLIESIIPSNTMREYHKEIGYEYTDKTLAAMITWSSIPLFRKVDELKRIKGRCSDTSFEKELENYIAYLEYSYKGFVYNNEKESIYVLYVQWDEESDYEENGYFLNFRDALEFSKRSGSVEKRIDKIRPVKSADEYKGDEEEFMSNEIGYMGFDKDGEIIFCESYEVPEPEYSTDAFHTSYIKIPYPFRFGDIVRILSDDNRLGIVQGYKTDEEIEAEYERLKEHMDFSDFQVPVESFYYNSKDDTFGWGHSHIVPINLEFANIDRDNLEEGSEEDLMLMASHLLRGEAGIWCLEYAEAKYKERFRNNNS